MRDRSVPSPQSNPPVRRRSSPRTSTADEPPEIDIEDLYDARCILVCAPVVPSQSEQDYPLSSTFDGTYDPIEKLAHFYPPARKFAGESSQRTRTQTRTQTQQREPRPRSRLHSRLSSPSSPSQPGHDPNVSSSQCLLERVNPDYFGRDKYKWHSSMVRDAFPDPLPTPCPGSVDRRVM